ncbi:MAG: ABC transporter ATP-binding protein [Desulfobacterales bacterium]|nr:ABC transporter ATP-binding protein [Desulfobacterales bacterium]MDD4393115.1 ABC transporter ATP-binding protein [Desulfobacterales bacterium]
MIQIEHLNVHFPGFSLQDINLSVDRGEFFALIGPTGAGKTLVLESIVGLVPVAGGRILIDNRDITRLAPEKRKVGIVYQDHALFPHLTVHENILFGLRYHSLDGKKAKKRVDMIIQQLRLECILKRSVVNLSGGEKQRTALARALAVDPAILLLDEPMSALDPNFREDIRQILKDLHSEMGMTLLMVTHDFSEAHFLAQRVGVMNKGRIEQIGSVSDVFNRPATEGTARFVGMKNIFPAKISGDKADVKGLVVCIPAGKGDSSYIAVRPEDVRLSCNAFPCGTPNCFEGRVDTVMMQGFYCEIRVVCSEVSFSAFLSSSEWLRMNLKKSDPVYMAFDPSMVHVF